MDREGIWGPGTSGHYRSMSGALNLTITMLVAGLGVGGLAPMAWEPGNLGTYAMFHSSSSTSTSLVVPSSLMYTLDARAAL
jgi:hypothetical protein